MKSLTEVNKCFYPHDMEEIRTPEHVKATIGTLQLGIELFHVGMFPGERSIDVANFMQWLIVTAETLKKQLQENGSTPKIVRS